MRGTPGPNRVRLPNAAGGAIVALILGLGLSFLSALASNVGFLFRHRGAVDAPEVDASHPLRSAIDLFRSKWWTIGYGFAIVAYGLHVAALGLAPLSIVQAVLAGGLVLLGVLAERFFGFELGRREWTGITLTAVGLAFLALTGDARSGQESANYSVPAMIAFESALVGIGTILLLSHRVERARESRGVLLGLAAGLLFTVTHIAVKALSGRVDVGAADVLLSPYLLLAILGGVVAFFASARSLQIGPPVPVIAITSIAGNASAIPAGIVVFGDPLGGDAAEVAMRSLAFLLVVFAAALIPAPHRAADRLSSGSEPSVPRPPRREGFA
jgi:drug/metabolite transporter (DMT)-like permease